VTSENIEFIDVGVKLNVVPAINTDGFVTMKIKPEVSSVRETVTTALGSRIPVVETAESETVVKVKDGVMIMIAGLMKQEKHDDIAGTPELSRIPFLGALFGNRNKQTKKTELIVFLTPHIITGDTTIKGTEPDKLIPSDMVPNDMLDNFVVKKLGEIKVDQTAVGHDADDLAPDAEAYEIVKTGEGAKSTAGTQRTAKGIKHF
jgi:Flp pilus assembly secretin CpaC